MFYFTKSFLFYIIFSKRRSCITVSLTLIWVGFLGVRFELGIGRGKITIITTNIVLKIYVINFPIYKLSSLLSSILHKNLNKILEEPDWPFVILKLKIINFIFSLWFILALAVICSHSLTFIVTRCHSFYHSLSLDLPPVCLFVNICFLNIRCKKFSTLRKFMRWIPVIFTSKHLKA